MRILLVEDSVKTADWISRALRREGFEVTTLRDGNAALAALENDAFAAVVLDIMLLGLDGLSVLRRMRAQGDRTPVLVLSARGELSDRVEGLDAGAEDYLAKPFAMEELTARVRALVRRRDQTEPTVLRVGDLTLDTRSRLATRAGRTIELTPREFRLLEFLMRSAGRVCSRMIILERVWDYHFDPGSNLVDVYIRKLREKLEPAGASKLLHSVRGRGYVLEARP